MPFWISITVFENHENWTKKLKNWLFEVLRVIWQPRRGHIWIQLADLPTRALRLMIWRYSLRFIDFFLFYCSVLVLWLKKSSKGLISGTSWATELRLSAKCSSDGGLQHIKRRRKSKRVAWKRVNLSWNDPAPNPLSRDIFVTISQEPLRFSSRS